MPTSTLCATLPPKAAKAKASFIPPAEVSHIVAQILGIGHAPTTNDPTVYDRTCSLGSLLLKVGHEATGKPNALSPRERRHHHWPSPHELDTVRQCHHFSTLGMQWHKDIIMVKNNPS